MALDAAFWASSTALTAKVAFAGWTAAWLLVVFDGRRITLSWQILLLFMVVFTSYLASRQSALSEVVWLWRFSALLSAFCVALTLAKWLSNQPSQTVDEASSADPRVKKYDASINFAQRLGMGQAFPRTANEVLLLVGASCTAVALGISVYRIMPGSTTLQWLALVHIFAASLLLGVILFCALELTFGNASDALPQVNWEAIARLALACCLCELLIGGVILALPTGGVEDLGAILIARMFAISLLLIDMISWVIPYRVASFKRASSKRSNKTIGWVSLSLAAWICLLSLMVLLALPSAWPWHALTTNH